MQKDSLTLNGLIVLIILILGYFFSFKRFDSHLLVSIPKSQTCIHVLP